MRSLIGIALCCLAGCSSVPKDESTADLRSPGERIINGREVFRQHCQECHPSGKAGLGPTLAHIPGPDFMIKSQVRLGLGAMPSFKKNEIGAGDLNDLVAYVNELRKGEPIPETQPQ